MVGILQSNIVSNQYLPSQAFMKFLDPLFKGSGTKNIILSWNFNLQKLQFKANPAAPKTLSQTEPPAATPSILT